MHDVPTVGANARVWARCGARPAGATGFTITVKTYRDFMQNSGLQQRLDEVLRAARPPGAMARARPRLPRLVPTIAEVFESVGVGRDARASSVVPTAL
jgi:hypothetical protein